MRTRRSRRGTRRQRGGSLADLLAHIQKVCRESPEGETFCMDNADAVLAYYRKKGKKFEPHAELPATTHASVIVIKFTVSHDDDVLMRHGFALLREGDQWFRADSWQGIHPFALVPIDTKDWRKTWRHFMDTLADGHFKREQLVELFGDWPAEKEALRAQGEWVNDYPRGRTGKFVVHTTAWSD